MYVNLRLPSHPFYPPKLKNLLAHDFEILKCFSILALIEFYSFFKNKENTTKKLKWKVLLMVSIGGRIATI